MQRIAFILFAFVFCAQIATAQIDSLMVGNCETGRAEAYLDVGNVRARLLNTGGLFYRGSPDVYEVPKGSGLKSIFAANLLIGGMVDGQLRTAGAAYGPYEFWPGPISAPGLPPPSCAEFDAIYSIDRAQDLDPFKDGVITKRVREWPAELGAPYVDVNGVSGYQFDDGDYPEILGDQMHWWVMNDAGNLHIRTQSNPLGVEARVSAFAFGSQSNLKNVTFYRYEIKNRGLKPIEQAYIGHLVDADLGNFLDDRFGSDARHSMIYFYNADNDDERNYGENPPAQGIAIIEASSSQGDLPSDISPGRIEGLMTNAMMYWGGGGPQGDPGNASDTYNYLRSRWKDGSVLRDDMFGGISEAPFVPMMFSGDPVTGGFWSEVNIDGNGKALALGDRRGIGSYGPFDLNPNETATFTFAYVWARGDNNLDSITALRQLVSGVHSANSSLLQPRQEPQKFVDNSLPERPQQSFWLNAPYPNPSNGSTTIRYSLTLDGPTEVAVYDVLSRKVTTLHSGTQTAGPHEVTFDVSSLPPGIYTIRLQSNRNDTSRQLTVVR
ncbi:T9SS type A sorting domain-containing protein [bacterium]|nr:T9SS type A sorting domain-containing protein [bacterium]